MLCFFLNGHFAAGAVIMESIPPNDRPATKRKADSLTPQQPKTTAAKKRKVNETIVQLQPLTPFQLDELNETNKQILLAEEITVYTKMPMGDEKRLVLMAKRMPRKTAMRVYKLEVEVEKTANVTLVYPADMSPDGFVNAIDADGHRMKCVALFHRGVITFLNLKEAETILCNKMYKGNGTKGDDAKGKIRWGQGVEPRNLVAGNPNSFIVSDKLLIARRKGFEEKFLKYMKIENKLGQTTLVPPDIAGQNDTTLFPYRLLDTDVKIDAHLKSSSPAVFVALKIYLDKQTFTVVRYLDFCILYHECALEFCLKESICWPGHMQDFITFYVVQRHPQFIRDSVMYMYK